MPIHDWTRVAAGIFHDFHNTWIIALKNQLNEGLLPPGYYAISEQRAGRLTSQARRLPRTMAIRRISDHQEVAFVEIASPPDKDRESLMRDFVEAVASALRQGRHVLVIDIIPPHSSDPFGIHGAIWQEISGERCGYEPPRDEPLTLASYAVGRTVTAYVEPTAVGSRLPDMPLFLDPDFYINVPLEETYQSAWQGVPAVWRDVIEGNSPPPQSSA